MAEFTSYKNKLKDFGIRKGSFKGDNGEPVEYMQLVMITDEDGETEETILSGKSAPKPKMLNKQLKYADRQTEEGTILDDETN